MSEYNRIYQVVHGVIKEDGNPERGCTLFAIIGSLILNKHFGIGSRPVAGAFVMCVEPGKNMFYGRDGGGKIEFDENDFHMWVQTETHIIDFMAPLYQEAFANVQSEIVIPRKMFQKKRARECHRIDDLVQPGDFITFPDPELSENLTDRILSRPINTDIIQIAECWYGGRRTKQKPTMMMGSNDGIVRNLSLPDTTARGAW
tara:strand:- start:416 stop:1021 length:606 start_codon:yes stop_codon:yes gene_type:complete